MFRYRQLGEAGRAALRDAVRRYARTLDSSPDASIASDLTGFSPQAVRSAGAAVRAMGMGPGEWYPQSLFSPASKRLSGLIKVMASSIPEVGDIPADMPGSRRTGGDDVAGIISEWVRGSGIPRIAQGHFGGAGRDGVTKCVLAIYGRSKCSQDLGPRQGASPRLAWCGRIRARA